MKTGSDGVVRWDKIGRDEMGWTCASAVEWVRRFLVFLRTLRSVRMSVCVGCMGTDTDL